MSVYISNKSKPNLLAGGISPKATGLIQCEPVYCGGFVNGEVEPVEPIKTYTFTITPTPENAVVMINGVQRKIITAPEGTAIKWTVSLDGYISQDGELTLSEDKDISVALEAMKYTFTIETTPSDATVTINGENRNTFTADYNTVINWSVSAVGYEDKQGSLTLTEDTNLPVSLKRQIMSLTITPEPTNAVVMINGVQRKTINVEYGTSVEWSVSSEGYTSQSGTLVLTENKTMPVLLERVKVTFAINPNPSNAVVTINGQIGKSVVLEYGSQVNWSVEAEGYTAKSGNLTLNKDTTLNVDLELVSHTFTIKPTPANAIVTINGQVGNSFVFEYGTQVEWSISCEGYIAQSGDLVLREDTIISVELELVKVALTINPTPSNATVKINGTEQKTITVDYGTAVSWTVSAEGYAEQNGTLVLKEDTTLPVKLSLKPVTFKISPNPTNAIVTINGEERNTFTTVYGTPIEWTVSANGYVAQTGDLTLTEDTTLSVELELVKYTLTIVPTPSNAVVTINGEERNTFTAVSGTSVTWQVSASGYSQQNGTLTLNADETLEIVLEKSGVKKIEGNSTLWILKTTGDLYATGSNTYGQVGNGGTDDVLSVTKIASNVSDVSAYSSTTAYITKTNELLTCGNNANGQVGSGTSTTKVTRFGNRASDVKKVMADANTTFYLTNGGVLYGCGSDSNGQQGNGSSSSSNVISFEEKAKNVKDFYVGNNLTAYITNNNELYLTGLNGAGQQGSGDKTTVISFTKRADNAESCALTDYNSFYLTPSGELYGTGSRFLLGNYSENQTSFVKVAENVKSFSAGYRDLFYIDTNNVLYGLGRNESGVQGDGTTTQVTSFVKKAENVKKVIVTQYTAGYLTLDGGFYLCGVNTYGQQGNGTTDAVLSFTKRADNVKDIHLGTQTTFYVTNDEEVYGCGRNTFGQMGNGTTEDVLSFTKVNI